VYVAQFNISRERESLDHPLMQDFVERLAPVNAIADAWDGFVWRLKDDSGNATAIRTYEDPAVIFNLSVWKTVEQLKEYVYRSGHADVLRKRLKWFGTWDRPSYVLWWVAEDELPSLEEAKHRLAHLQDNGPSAYAFSFTDVHEPAAGHV
jgi:hypothetical protein